MSHTNRRRLKNYSFSEKKQALEYFFTHEVKPKDLSEITGINLATIYTWLRSIEWDMANIERLRTTCTTQTSADPSALAEEVQQEIMVRDW
ncbi:hypothetical protein BVY04_04850 [bacterium M21]|nr:hypothetical protein BVY04_04850 [bacterium M21]